MQKQKQQIVAAVVISKIINIILNFNANYIPKKAANNVYVHLPLIEY